MRDSNRLDEVEVPPASAFLPGFPKGIERSHDETAGLSRIIGDKILTVAPTGSNTMGLQKAGEPHDFFSAKLSQISSTILRAEPIWLMLGADR